ncbi:MAG: A/G-specific adenine glycosylase [Chloroflexi bacterium]|nr:A/G-specific adenine glycosylase [Chloroflexota bacterium]
MARRDPSRAAVARLMRWYARAARDLPWRRTRDPYAIWVSEVMLQQTRVAKVIPYYTRFLKRFPTRARLARASLREVLRAWEGMGYYARARNLHRAARAMAPLPEAAWPTTAEAWQRVPGVGRYTASAIASIAFGEVVPVLDGNTRRVLARLDDYAGDARSARGEAQLLGLAARMMPARNPCGFNQGLMELGATLCTPRAPQCARCPLREACRANTRGTQALRPRPRVARRVPHLGVACGIVRRADRVLIAQRPAKALLGGLWEFPGGKRKRGETLAACLRRELREELGIRVRVGRERGALDHAYSHYSVTLHVFECTLVSGTPCAIEAADVRWARARDLARYPMGKLDRQVTRLFVG